MATKAQRAKALKDFPALASAASRAGAEAKQAHLDGNRALLDEFNRAEVFLRDGAVSEIPFDEHLENFARLAGKRDSVIAAAEKAGAAAADAVVNRFLKIADKVASEPDEAEEEEPAEAEESITDENVRLEG